MECINANKVHRKSGVSAFPRRKAHKDRHATNLDRKSGERLEGEKESR
jgi:hypothetical protein